MNIRSFDYQNLVDRQGDNEIASLIAQIQSTQASNEIEGIRTTNTRLKQPCADKTAPHNRDEREIIGYQGEVDPLILIPIFIHDFLCIHPFNDGNGRMSRLLTTLLLHRSGYLVGKYISLENKIAKNKGVYYGAMQECRAGWKEGAEKNSPFIKYLLRIILAAYRDFEE